MSVREKFYEAIIKKDTGFFDDRKVGDICKLISFTEKALDLN